MRPPRLGLGLGWRPALASFVLERADLGFVEVLGEDLPPDPPLPLALGQARDRDLAVVVHSVRLSVGEADPPSPDLLAHLARLAEAVDAPVVSGHVAFVRAGGLEAGHLLPVPRTREVLRIAAENTRFAASLLPVPLALEPIATLVDWPAPELDEAQFLGGLLEATDALLLLDVANLYANWRNGGPDPVALLDRLPLERIAYVHVAGGVERAGLYHDTHAHPVPGEVLELLAELASRTSLPGVMLERDDRFPPTVELAAELDAIARAVDVGSRRRPEHAGTPPSLVPGRAPTHG